MLITHRQPYHDHEALLWALVYSRTICNYDPYKKHRAEGVQAGAILAIDLLQPP